MRAVPGVEDASADSYRRVLQTAHGPAVVAVYGAGAAGASAGTGLLDTPPTLLIAQAKRRTASTNGATLQQLESFLLSQPNISPQLAAEIRAIGQPSSTLPVPIISGLMTSESVTIDGVQGVVGACSEDQRRFVGELVANCAKDSQLLVVAERRRLAGRARDHEAVRAVLDQMPRQPSRAGIVDSAVLVERRDHGG